MSVAPETTATPNFKQNSWNLTFKNSDLEKEFIYFYYGNKFFRVIIFSLLGFLVWVAFGYFDYIYFLNERISLGVRIFNIVARVVLAIPMIVADILVCLPCTRKRPYFAEILICITMLVVTAGTCIKSCSTFLSNEIPDVHTGSFISIIGCILSIRARIATQYYITAITFASYVVAIFAFNYMAIRTHYVYMILWCVFILIVCIMGLVQLYVIESFFRRQFILLKKQLLVHEALDYEKQRSDQLLKNILPTTFVSKLKEIREQTIQESALKSCFVLEPKSDMSVLFSDIAGFTAFSSSCTAEFVVQFLNSHFKAFDQLCTEHHLEKVKTIGDAYFCVGMQKSHKTSIIQMGLDMQSAIHELNEKNNWSFSIRIGVTSGEGYLGVLGDRKLTFDCFGPAVTEAHYLESSGMPGKVHVSEKLAKETFEYFYYNYDDEKMRYFAEATKMKPEPQLEYRIGNLSRSASKSSSMVNLSQVSSLMNSETDQYKTDDLKYYKYCLQFRHFSTCKQYVIHDYSSYINSYRILLLNLCMQSLWCYSLFIYDNFATITTSSLYILVTLSIFQVLLILPFILFLFPCISRYQTSSYLVAIYSIIIYFAMGVLAIFYPARYDLSVILIQVLIDATFRWIPAQFFLFKVGFLLSISMVVTVIRLIKESSKIVPLADAVVLLGMLIVCANSAYFCTQSLIESFVLSKHMDRDSKRTEIEQEQNMDLILSVLPPDVADKVDVNSQKVLVDSISHGTACFVMVDGFETDYEKHAEKSLKTLHDLFAKFDLLCDEHNVQKIKSIQNVYLAVASHDKHIPNTCKLAFAMVNESKKLLHNRPNLSIKIGLATGPYVAGVLGYHKYLYDVFGDTINMASRMMTSSREPYSIYTTGQCSALASKLSWIQAQSIGYQQVKGKGSIELFSLSEK